MHHVYFLFITNARHVTIIANTYQQAPAICINLSGMHGGGAAWIAYRKFGAIMGQGVGLQGQSYGIPTMQDGVETIRPYVDEFIQFAKEHPELTFLVTRIGCGIAGFTDDDIAPLFEKAHDVENIVLPPGW